MAKVKVEFIKNGMAVGLAYFEGDTTEFDNKFAKELIELGYVKKWTVPKPKNPVIDLPDDIPGRHVLINKGIITLDEVKAINDLTEINGIGKTIAKQIKQFVDNL